MLWVVDVPLGGPQPAGAAAAHEGVPEDEEGGQQGHGGVEHDHHAIHVFEGYSFEIGMEPFYFRKDEVYDFCMNKIFMMPDVFIKQQTTPKNLECGNEEIEKSPGFAEYYSCVLCAAKN